MHPNDPSSSITTNASEAYIDVAITPIFSRPQKAAEQVPAENSLVGNARRLALSVDIPVVA